MGFCGPQRKKDNYRVRSFSENTKAQDESVSELTELQSRSHYLGGELYLTMREWQRFLEAEQRARDR